MSAEELRIQTSKTLEGLNPEQLELAQHIYGPILGIAGPGSGKTHTVVSRAAYMIESGIHPDNIVMFSFTKKAAGEMKERVTRRIPSAKTMTVGTYHSFCARLLRKYAHYLGFEANFSIYDSEDSKKLLKQVANDPFYKPELVLSKISDWKSRLITPTLAEQLAEDRFERKIASFYREYQKQMKQQNAMDFDDLIGNAIDLLTENPSVKREVNERYQYIFADEFQDSSKKDIELIRLLAGDSQNVCMIMDDCQSIYSFRGADIDAVLALEEVFPDLETYLLRQNYRSTSTIVGASMSLISHNSNQIEKEIFTDNEKGEKIVYMEALTQPDESAKVTKLIKGLVKTGEYTYKDIAILYRLSHLSRSIEDNLLSNSIPYSIVGGLPFYARKEIKDIMSYIRLLHNGKDKQAFERVVNVPKRGIGEKALREIMSVANEQKSATMNLIEVCKDVTLKGKAKKGLENFNEIMALLQDKSQSGLTPGELIEEVINVIDYKQYLLTEEDAEERLQNLIELKGIAEQYETLDDFIYNMSLNSIEDEDQEKIEDKVQLLTMHASKGLEFPVVIIIGANEGTTPHHKATTAKQVDEERRLFYVAISRAEKMLFITRPKNVTLKGQTIRTTASRFIDEIDDVYLMRV